MNTREPIKISDEFQHSIDRWIDDLHGYDLRILQIRPASDRWSMGQVYVHLIEATQHFLKQTRRCAMTDDNATEEASKHAITMFERNELPDELIEGPPSNQGTAQPENREYLERALSSLKKEVKELGLILSAEGAKGRMKHPGLKYLSAVQWFQFAEMHFRHHLRQKKRIDQFLSEHEGHKKQALTPDV